MMPSVIPARLQFQCGHAALVTLPKVKGETATQRNNRVAREKSAALVRQCDFCAPAVAELRPLVEPVNGNHVAVSDTAASDSIASLTVLVAAEPEAPQMTDAQSRPDPVAQAVEEVLAEVEARAEARAEAELEAAVEAEIVSELIADIASDIEAIAVETAQPETEPVVEIVVPIPTEVAEVTETAPRRTRRTRTPRQPRIEQQPVVEPQPVAVSQPRVGRTPRAVRAPSTPALPTPAPTARRHQYLAEFRVERVLRGADIRDVLRQLAAAGATDVVAVTRED